MATQEADFDDWNEEEEPEIDCWGQLQPLDKKYDTLYMTDENKKYSVGREGDLKIKMNVVSGKHCLIWKQAGAIFLEDRSTNGTFLKGERLAKRKPELIKSGTKITIVRPNAKSKIEEVSFLYLDAEEEKKGGIFDKYHFLEELGSGAFAEVRLGMNRETHEKFAIKIIGKEKHIKSSSRSLMDEVDILRKINHPGVVGIVDVFDDTDKLYLVLELVTGGELFDLINAKGVFEDEEARPLVKQMLDCLVYLHSNGIAHRDLKFENILLKDKNYDTIKISDFGLSRVIGEGSFMKTICGTPEYLAPEIMKPGVNTKGYSKAVDLWSMGVILYTMLCGVRPFESSEGNSVFNLAQEGVYEYPDDVTVSDEAILAKDLIAKMLRTDPSKRITADDAAVHPWISGKIDSDASAGGGEENPVESSDKEGEIEETGEKEEEGEVTLQKRTRSESMEESVPAKRVKSQ